MRRDFAVRIKPKLRNSRTEFGARRFEFVCRVLTHQQAAADAADKNGDAVAATGFTEAVDGLACGLCSTRGEAVEMAAHELRGPILRNVAGESHRSRLAVDGENGPDDVVLRPFGIEDPQRKQQTGSGQSFGFVFAEIALIE